MTYDAHALAWAVLLVVLAGPATGAPAPVAPCKLACDIGPDRYGFAISCEQGTFKEEYNDQESYEYGPTGSVSGIRLALNRKRTYASSGNTYELSGLVQVDKAQGTVAYNIRAVGARLGLSGQTCTRGSVEVATEKEQPAATSAPAPVPKPPRVELRVGADYRPSIVVPECETVLRERSAQSDSWACFASEKGEYVGGGKTWLLTPPEASLSVTSAFTQRVAVKAVERSGGAWDFEFGPPRNAPWRTGVVPAARVGDQGEHQATLSVSGHARGCGEVDGQLEILELVLDDTSHTLERIAANFTQVCTEARGDRKGLRGYLRFTGAAQSK